MLQFPFSVALGQVKLYSPVTQEWPTLFTTDFQEINREIWIENDKITIITQFSEAKEIEILNVDFFENSGDRMIFKCTSRNGASDLTVIIPNPTKATALDIYRISPKTGEEEQIRFHLEYSENSRQLNTRFKSI